MELLLSNFAPANITKESAKNYLESAIKNCHTLKIASGYVSSDALIELNRIIEINKRPRLELLIGMHYFDGFTKSQYEAACQLNTTLKSLDLGFVFISDFIKFHGKMYSFRMIDTSISAIVGSSNLGSLYNKVNRLYEADILLNGIESSVVQQSIDSIITKLGSPIEEIKIDSFVRYNKLLENHENVIKVDSEQKSEILANKSSVVFNIPVKTEPKSNLNAFFGKGRVDKRGYEMPRPWYEAEIIVSKKITDLPHYPCNQHFSVLTDDGWMFKCETNGDFSKNFRSKDDLKILGKWIKGRLEDDGALKIGQPVTKEVLQKYGRDNLTLSATSNPDIWILDFSI